MVPLGGDATGAPVVLEEERGLELIVVPLKEIHELESKVAFVRATGLMQRVRIGLRIREELYRTKAAETDRTGRFSAVFALQGRDDTPRGDVRLVSDKTVAQLSAVAAGLFGIGDYELCYL